LSPWARDRYLAFPIGDTTRVLLPRPDSVASSIAGDCDVARQLADWDPELELVESRLAIEGGDVLVSGAVVLVGATTILANADRFEEGPAGVEACLEELFDREVVVVGGREGAVPHEHLDMYVSFVGGRRLLLGDPRLTRRLFDRPDELENASLEARSIGVFSWQTQAEAATLYDELAGLLVDAGFLVQRLPILHTDDGDLLTWNNAVTERRGTRGTAYVPSYGIPSLDDLARRTWTQAGYEVKSVRCAQVIGEGGAVRCLTNVLRDRPVRGQSPPVGR
jgi:N-dimethylarginine dimethylaminohydrolase